MFVVTLAFLFVGVALAQPPSSKCVPDNFGYSEALDKSLLFYEAQRSGDLPENEMRVKWRKDSALGDRGDNGEDLTGGYYDAGDFVKFGFPFASTMTLLAWGGDAYKDGYEKAGMMQYLRSAVKWGTDYMLKCHISSDVFYGQVGKGDLDHAVWGRPEDMTMWRPAYKIDPQHPGSDLAGESAATLAAAAVLFSGVDDGYASNLRTHAEQLFAFADTHRGKYSDSITEADNYYRSWNGYNDELVWGAVWLYKATGQQHYLDKAKQYYDEFGLWTDNNVISWDDKTAGVKILLAELTGEQRFKNDLEGTCDNLLSIQQSPGGQVFIDQWGSLRYTANAAFVCLRAADVIGGSKGDAYRNFAVGQMEYILGKHGNSFVVGFGNNPPQRPHHRSSSCPNAPAPCNWDNFNNPGPNPQVLYGALVGGPKAADDYYVDSRQDFQMNEVALDYNAGFQSALAGLNQQKC